MEDHFAEKPPAYTAPHEFRTRVKDLVDMVLLIDQGLPPSTLLRKSFDATVKRYAGHPLPPALPSPPPEWQEETFPAMAGDAGVSVTEPLEAYKILQEFLGRF